MKNLSIIIQKSAQQDMADLLRGMQQVSLFIFSHVEGHGLQAESSAFLSAQDKVVGYTPRVKVEVLLEDANIKPVLASLRQSTKGIESQAIFWITAVEQSGRF